MSKNYGDIEQLVLKQFSVGEEFNFKKDRYKVLLSAKPRPSSGECKTDVYVKAADSDGNLSEFKISIKSANADFLENKITLSRAKQILGPEAHQIISNSLNQIKSNFLNDYLVTFNQYRKTEPKSIKIGWKFEFLDKGSEDCKIVLTDAQKIDIYAGTNLGSDKIHAKVKGITVPNSGISNYLLPVESIHNMSLQKTVDNLEDISDYARSREIYFACKAINYRATPDKWDGNRALAVYVDWKLIDGQLSAEVIFNRPLQIGADDVGNNIRRLLRKLQINSKNFEELEKYLKNVKYFK